MQNHLYIRIRPALTGILPLAITLLALHAIPQGIKAQTESAPNSQILLRVFIDGRYQMFGFDYIRTEIDFVDWVRDQADADVHIILTSERAGSGGSAYTLDFIGRKIFEGRLDTLVYTTSQTDTRDEQREGFVRVLKLGLVPYVMKTAAGHDIDLTYISRRSETEEAPVIQQEDPWNYWIFRTSLNGNLNSEQSKSNTSTRGSFSARRVTEAWKVSLSFNGNYSERRNELSTGTSISYSHTLGLNGLVVKSLGDHWSAGIKTSASSSTSLNQKMALSLAPAVEYSLFPYSEFTRRQLTFQYTVGANSYEYMEQTNYGELEELRFNQTLGIKYEVTQPWGSASVSIEGAHYFFDAKKYHLSFDTRWDIRLFRGFSLDLSGGYDRIYDQLYIANLDISDEDFLLDLRKLQTNYEFNIRIGFSYTFGSIFNTVVNSRLQEERRGGNFRR